MIIALAWSKNPDIDKLMTFEDDPFGEFEPEPWDSRYQLVWYIDPRFNPLPDKVWAVSCKPIGRPIEGVKDMGYLVPKVNIEYNNELPDLGVDFDKCCPAFWELENEIAWELDPACTLDERIWVVRMSPAYRKPKNWVWYGTITPEYHVEYNPKLPVMDYDVDYVIPYHDFTFEHVWMLDRKHLQHDEDDIWAFKICVTPDIEGSKNIDYISPIHTVEYNPELPKFNLDIDYVIPWYDLSYSHVWNVAGEEKIWAIALSTTNPSVGIKEMPNIIPALSDNLDVIFISYYELNAEKNWQRVLKKAPWAKRINGVKGIFEAHKAAAKISSTDMFYIVDGDAYLVDDWEFNFQPGVFDRNCAYVWSSRNPVNSLTYAHGGVKLFNKNILMSKKKWTTLDMFTGIMPKIKVEEKISCFTNFNVDEFSTWRSAFRECTKLYKNNQMSKINEWLRSNTKKKFGSYAVLGAVNACQYAKEFLNDNDALLMINDYDWLKEYFNKMKA